MAELYETDQCVELFPNSHVKVTKITFFLSHKENILLLRCGHATAPVFGLRGFSKEYFGRIWAVKAVRLLISHE